MKTFAYRGYDAAGRAQKGLIEAIDLREARERLHHTSVFVESLEEAQHALRGLRAPGLESRAQLYREWGALLRAGVPVTHALDIIFNGLTNAGFRQIVATVRDRIREGVSVARAMAETIPSAPAYETTVIEAGERTAMLGEVMERLATSLEERAASKERIISALVYPSFVIVLAIAVVIAAFGYVLPEIERSMPKPVLIDGLSEPSAESRTVFLPLMIGLPPLLLIGVALAMRSPAQRMKVEERLLRWPVAGSILSSLAGARFADTLALLLRGGVQMVDAVRLAGQATGNRVIIRDLDQVADEVQHGKSLSNALQHIPALSGVLSGWISAGEASGELPDLLESASSRLRMQWQQRIARMLSLLEPVMIVLIGLVVLMIVQHLLGAIALLDPSEAGWTADG